MSSVLVEHITLVELVRAHVLVNITPMILFGLVWLAIRLA